MSDDRNDVSVLVKGVNSYEARMVKTLLEDVGVPCMFEGPDFDVAELGRAAHDNFRGVDVLVPTAALERARARLAEAWPDAGAHAPSED